MAESLNEVSSRATLRSLLERRRTSSSEEVIISQSQQIASPRLLGDDPPILISPANLDSVDLRNIPITSTALEEEDDDHPEVIRQSAPMSPRLATPRTPRSRSLNRENLRRAESMDPEEQAQRRARDSRRLAELQQKQLEIIAAKQQLKTVQFVFGIEVLDVASPLLSSRTIAQSTSGDSSSSSSANQSRRSSATMTPISPLPRSISDLNKTNASNEASFPSPHERITPRLDMSNMTNIDIDENEENDVVEDMLSVSSPAHGYKPSARASPLTSNRTSPCHLHRDSLPPQIPLGVRIITVKPDSSAAKAGLQVNDIIKTINETKIMDKQHYKDITKFLTKEDEIVLGVERDGQLQTISLNSCSSNEPSSEQTRSIPSSEQIVHLSHEEIVALKQKVAEEANVKKQIKELKIRQREAEENRSVLSEVVSAPLRLKEFEQDVDRISQTTSPSRTRRALDLTEVKGKLQEIENLRRRSLQKLTKQTEESSSPGQNMTTLLLKFKHETEAMEQQQQQEQQTQQQ